MRKGQHTAPKPRRKGWKALLPASLFGKVALGGSLAAMALWLVSLGFAGSTTAGNFSVIPNSATSSVTAGTCTLDSVSLGSGYTVSWTGVNVLDTCSLDAGVNVASTNSDSAVVVGVVNVPAGLEASTTAACTTLPSGDSAIPVVLTLAETSTPGQVIDHAGMSLDIVPSALAASYGC